MEAWKALYSSTKADFTNTNPRKKVLFVTITTPNVMKTPNMNAVYHGIVGKINTFLNSLNEEMPKTCTPEGRLWNCATANASIVKHTIGIDDTGKPDASKSDDGIHFFDDKSKQIADIVSATVNKWLREGQ